MSSSYHFGAGSTTTHRLQPKELLKLKMTSESSREPMIRTAPPQVGQVSLSMPKNRFERQVYFRLQPLLHILWLPAKGRLEPPR